MSRLRVESFAVSIDGYGAGPGQDIDNPLGNGGLALHDWIFNTRTFRRLEGETGGSGGIDDDFVARGFNADWPPRVSPAPYARAERACRSRGTTGTARTGVRTWR